LKKSIILLFACFLLAIPNLSVVAKSSNSTVGDYYFTDTQSMTIDSNNNIIVYRTTNYPVAMFYEKDKLSDFTILINQRQADGTYQRIYLEWQSRDVILAEGIQIVNALYGEKILSVTIIAEPNVKKANEEDQIITDEPDIVPELNVKDLILGIGSTYGIKIDNQVQGSSYEWNSGNTKTLRINKQTGLVRATSQGKTIVTCKVTTPDNKTHYLVANVTVGTDSNIPNLTATELNLSTGNKFDIDIGNKIAKSKYKFTSSDTGVATVNSSNGYVTTRKAGKAVIFCTITAPEKKVIVLKCDVVVTTKKSLNKTQSIYLNR
jgi:hypothetical protein